MDELQADLENGLKGYNEERVHPGKSCFGKTPMQTSLDLLPTAKVKLEKSHEAGQAQTLTA